MDWEPSENNLYNAEFSRKNINSAIYQNISDHVDFHGICVDFHGIGIGSFICGHKVAVVTARWFLFSSTGDNIHIRV